MIKFIKIFFFLLSLNIYSQQKSELNIYIYISKCSNINITKAKDKNLCIESYRLSWPSTINYKKLSLKVNEKDELVSSISISGNSKEVNFIYKNENNNNLPIKIKKDKTINIIRYDDFIYYEDDLVDIFKKAKNLYVILENDAKENYYIAKKIKLDYNFARL